MVNKTITDPHQIYEAFDWAEQQPHIHTIVIDTLTFLMDMYESEYVINSSNTMAGWSNYAQFFKRLMQQHVAASTKKVVFLAHTSDMINDDAVMETMVKVKGSLMNQGVEAFFSCVLSTKKVSLKELADYSNDLLHITEKDQMLGYKHVYQTSLTKKTIGERIRTPDEMYSIQETYIDNDVQQVLDRLDEYYA